MKKYIQQRLFSGLYCFSSGRTDEEGRPAGGKKSLISQGLFPCSPTFPTFSPLLPPPLAPSLLRGDPSLPRDSWLTARGAVQKHNYCACHYSHHYCLSDLRDYVVSISISLLRVCARWHARTRTYTLHTNMLGHVQ